MDDMATHMVEIANRIGLPKNEQCHQAQCKVGCRAARANLDGPFADVDQKPNHGDASSVDNVDRHVGLGKTKQAGRICERYVQRLGADHDVRHRTV